MEMTQTHTPPQFQPGDYVSYGSFGVCRVIGLETCTLHDDTPETYYKLCPVDGSHSTYYIPLDRAESRIRHLLRPEQIHALIDQMALPQTTAWCSDSRARRDLFQGILHSDDYVQIIQMMHALHQQKQQRRSTGHKLSAADEAVMHAAESRMYQEFGIVLGIPPESVHDYIAKRLAQHT